MLLKGGQDERKVVRELETGQRRTEERLGKRAGSELTGREQRNGERQDKVE